MKAITFTLTKENINKCVTMIKQKCEASRANTKMLIKTCMSIEEILLDYQAFFGESHEVSLKYKVRLSDLLIILDLPGNHYNPFEDEENNNFILDVLNFTPRYSYYDGINRFTFNVKINLGGKDFFTILIAVFIGITVGYFGKMMPENILTPCHLIVQEISNTIFGLMQMIALPVIFLCIIYGILGSGTISSFKEKGRSVISKIFLSIFLMLLLTTAVSCLIFGIKFISGSMDNSSFKDLIDTIFSIFPDNILAPFFNGDNIKVIILGIIFGCGLLVLGDKVNQINQLIVQLKDAFSTIMAWIGKLIPLLAAIVLIDNIWSGAFGPEFLKLWKIVAVYVAVVLLILLYYIIRVSHKHKIPVKTVAKTVLVPGMKGLVSASSMFCYSDMEDGLRRKLKISDDKINFGIPLGFAFYQPITVLYAIFILYFAGISAVPVNATWMASFLLSCFVTGIAAPPVSGGSVTLLGVLFASMGITNPAIAMAYPLFMLLDYPNTAFRVMAMMLELAKD